MKTQSNRFALLCPLICAIGSALFLLPALAPVHASQGTSPSPAQQTNGVPEAALVQPIPFSHKKHATLQLPCEYCHAKVEDGVRISYPETATCMECHRAIAKDKPAIEQLAAFHAAGKKVPWEQVYSVPGFVFWSHQTHLQGGVPCASCHGDVREMETMRKVTNVTTMAGCVDCHKAKSAPTGCLVCHETQSSQWLDPRISSRRLQTLALLQR